MDMLPDTIVQRKPLQSNRSQAARVQTVQVILVLILWVLLSACQPPSQDLPSDSQGALPPEWTATPRHSESTKTPSAELPAEASAQATRFNTPEPPERSTSFEPPPQVSLSGFTWDSAVDGKTMVYIPAGNFYQGARDDFAPAEPDERPQKRITLNAFWIAQTEVTNQEYAACVQAGGCTAPAFTGLDAWSDYYGNPDLIEYPVIGITWYQARDYCAWIGGSLPTEAQWEKAARGRDGRRYPWEWVGSVYNSSGEIRLNYCDENCTKPFYDDTYNDGYASTAPVGSYPAGASPYGVLDMAGNVWEWTADWYRSDYYSSSPDTNPTGPENGVEKVIKGGSWLDTPYKGIPLVFRSSNRSYRSPTLAYNDLGFRCILPATVE